MKIPVCPAPPRGRKRGFTLVEVLVAVAVLALVMLMLLTLTSQVGAVWKRASSQIEQFRDARDAFESLTHRLSQATLNTYWDYDNPQAPTRYLRQSELRFICGRTGAIAGAPPAGRQWPADGIFFQAPLGFSDNAATQGLENLLNTCGYFVEFGDDAALRPPILTTDIVPLRYRYRLMEFIQPTTALNLYNYTSGQAGGVAKNLSYTGHDWFASDLLSASPPVHVLAENVIALVVLPKLSTQEDATGALLAPAYAYDSTATKADARINPKNQLPPVVQVVMVAIDEASALHLANGPTMPDFGLDSFFNDANRLDDDLRQLQQRLAQLHVNFRVFSTNVGIRGAKWSQDQQN